MHSHGNRFPTGHACFSRLSQTLIAHAIVLFSFFISCFLAQNAFASCEIGAVLFRDTVYGAGLGAGVGALVLVANQNSNNIAPTLATSALVGGGIGAAIGALELSFSDCTGGGKKRSRSESEEFGFSIRPLFNVANEYHNSLAYSKSIQSYEYYIAGLSFHIALN